MAVLFVEYPKCSTCKKAKAWLDEHGVEYIDRDIVLDNPTADELATWIARSGLLVRRFFNSSGMKYRELGLKARLDVGMTDRECYELLATDGMLVKRPLLVGDDFAIPGFREAALAAAESASRFECSGWDALSAGGPAPVSPPAAPIRADRRPLRACWACRSSTPRP